jgi:hypothetical protein
MTQAHSSCQDWLGSQGAKICTRSSIFSHIGEMGGRLNTAKGPPPHPRTVSCFESSLSRSAGPTSDPHCSSICHRQRSLMSTLPACPSTA